MLWSTRRLIWSCGPSSLGARRRIDRSWSWSSTVKHRNSSKRRQRKQPATSATSTSRRMFSEHNGDKHTVASRLARLEKEPGGILAWAQRLTADQKEKLMHLLPGMEGAVAAMVVPEPSRRALKLVALNTAIPFVGFGIMDNAILIIAGDAIDTSLGVMLGISTMCAAAIGNIISDVAGILLGTAIEDVATKLNLPTPDLTTAQRQLRSVRFASQFGCAVGVVVGCIIGMFPLFFIDSNKVQAKKREAHLDSIFRDVVTEAAGLIGAGRTCLYLLVSPDDDDENKKKRQTKKNVSPMPAADGKFLYIKYNDKASAAKGAGKDRYIPLGRGIVSRSILTGEAWNIQDVATEPDFVPDIGYADATAQAAPSSGPPTRSMLCVPVMDSSGRPIAVIQAINKVGKGREDDEGDVVPMLSPEPRSFTESDVQILKALASHISVSLQRMYEQADGEDAEMRLKDTIRLLKDYGLAGISSKDDFEQRGSRMKLVRRPLFPEDN